MDDAKKTKIIEAATKIFAVKGYQYATIADIAKEAGVSTGFMYSYFVNKLDVLLSIILSFWKLINRLNELHCAAAKDPVRKLHAVLFNLESLLIKNEKALYLVRVLSEALPHIVMIKDKRLQKKRREIIAENKKFIHTVDAIITEGQKAALFDCSLKSTVMRQALCGAVERMIYGLFFKAYSGEDIGYNIEDAHSAAVRLVETFIMHKGSMQHGMQIDQA